MREHNRSTHARVEWPVRWIDRVRLYRGRIKDEALRLNVGGPPPPLDLMVDTSNLGEDIGRIGCLLSWLPIGRYPDRT